MKKTNPRTRKRVLIVSDGKRGHLHQSEGIVRKMHNIMARKLEIRMSKPYYFFLIFASFLARRFRFSQPLILFWIQKVTDSSIASLIKFAPDLIISAGSLTHPVTFLLGRIWDCRTVVCMRPSILSPTDFSLVVAPRHDEYRCSGDNIIYTMGATSHISEGFIFAEAVALYPRLKGNVSSPIGLLIGGDSALNSISPETGAELAKEVLLLCEENNLSLLATTSRRTRPATEKAVSNLIAPHPATSFLLLASESPENPVPGIIGMCEVVLVTEDSVSMVSEIISGGRQAVVVRVGRRKKRNKFEKLFEDLQNEGYIAYTSIEDLNQNVSQLLNLRKKGLKPFDESKRVADEIEKRFFSGPPSKGAKR